MLFHARNVRWSRGHEVKMAQIRSLAEYFFSLPYRLLVLIGNCFGFLLTFESRIARIKYNS